MNTKIKSLKNIKIIEKTDKNLNTYYIIFNQNSTNERSTDSFNKGSEAYFCFANTVKEGWQEFKDNWQNISRIELEYEENEKGNKVIRILAHDQSLDIFI